MITIFQLVDFMQIFGENCSFFLSLPLYQRKHTSSRGTFSQFANDVNVNFSCLRYSLTDMCSITPIHECLRSKWRFFVKKKNSEHCNHLYEDMRENVVAFLRYNRVLAWQQLWNRFENVWCRLNFSPRL